MRLILTIVCVALCVLSGCSDEVETTHSVTVDGVVRGYSVHVPSGYDGATALPVLFNFHGNGGTAQSFMDWTDMTALADQERFLLIYPQGSLLDGAPHWNPSPPGEGNKSTADDLGFVAAMLDAVIAEYNVDAQRVYACGYSNGGMMAYGLACAMSERIAAVGSVSGTMLGGAESCVPGATHPMPVINIHGTDDFVLPYEGAPGYTAAADVMAYWAGVSGITEEPVMESQDDDGTVIERYLYEAGDSGSTVAHYKVIGGGHVWFTDLTYEGEGTGELVWGFLSQFDLEGAR